VPADFDVLVKELKGLALDVELIGQRAAEAADEERESERVATGRASQERAVRIR
jgi:hypothetical protein